MSEVITPDRLKTFHKECSYHREVVLGGDDCSCFYCNTVFPPTDIVRWTDKDQTAICPRCGIDSILPGEVTKDLLVAMHHNYFCTGVNMTTGEEINCCDC